MTPSLRSRRGSAGSAMVWLVLLIVVAALAGAAWMVLRDPAPSESTPTSPKPETANSSDASREADRTETPAPDNTLRGKKSEKGINFTVVCLGPDGASQPLANLEVRAAPALPTGIDRENETAVRTNAEGVAVFEKMPYTIYDVSVEPDGLVPLRLRGAKDGKRIELVFRKGIPLTGVVTNAQTGAPIPEAWVQVRSDFGISAITKRIQIALQQGVDPLDIEGYDKLNEPQPYFRAERSTDAEGKFTVTAIPTAHLVEVQLDHDDFDTFEERFEIKNESELQKAYPLLPRTEIFGKVVADESGEPIVGARVQAGEGGIPINAIAMLGGNATVFESVTDANGNYRLKRVPRGRQYVYIHYPGYEDYAAQFEIKQVEAYEHQIRLRRSASVLGQVIDSANNPIEGVNIYWEVPEAAVLGHIGGMKDPSARTGADGTFELRGLPVGRPFNVLARHPEFVNAQQDSLVLQPGEEMSGVQIILNRGGQISGTVVDALRQPIAGAVIVARPVKPAGIPLAPVSSAPDGTFLLENTQPATFELACEAPGYVKTVNSNVRDLASGVQFVMLKEAIFAGRFLDSAGAPVTKFRIRVRPSEAFGNREIRSEMYRDKQGKFEVKSIAPGLYDFELSAEGMTPVLKSRVAFKEGEKIENQEFRAAQGASVKGTVKSVSGKPIAPALVRLEYLESFSPEDKTYTTLQASTNSTGEFEIPNLLPGRYKMWASHPAFAPSGDREIVVEDGPPQLIDFNLPKPGALRLVVRDADGNTVPTAQAWLFKGDSPLDGAEKIARDGMVGLKIPGADDMHRSGVGASSNPTSRGGPKYQVGDTGEITFSRKEPGNWTLWVTGEGFYKYTARLTLEAGKETVHEAELIKLQSGLSQRDAYKGRNVDISDRAKRRHDEEGKRTAKRSPEEEALDAEQRRLMQKQRDGEELTAEEMKILKDARRTMRESAKGTDDPLAKEGHEPAPGNEAKAAARARKAKKRQQAGEETGAESDPLPEAKNPKHAAKLKELQEKKEQKQKEMKEKQDEKDGQGNEGGDGGGGG